MKEIPAISVVIPMYNVEKYIGDCLDSLLNQTFQNFEVIIVDDCSTDNSVAIVERYAEKFRGRLRLKIMRKKSAGGGGYAPRNKGVKLSIGKYLFFLDGDDAITPTALEELYRIAEFYNADVVHCEKFYCIPDTFWDNLEIRKQIKPYNYLTGEKILVKTPLVWENNFEERINYFCQRKLIWNIWAQFIRRDFVVDNELTMSDAVAQDMVFTICELCSAIRYVIVPNVVNYYRVRTNSVTTEQINVANFVHKWLNSFKCGIKFIDNFLSDREFFSRRNDLKYILLNTFAQEILGHLNEVYAQIPAYALDELVRQELGKDSAFETFIFNMMNVQRLQLLQTQHQFNRLAAQIRQQ